MLSAVSRGILLAVALCAAPARADPTDPASAEAVFRAARAAQARGDDAHACALFDESYRLEPAAGTLLNLAACEERAGHVAKAWELYHHALDVLPSGDDRVALADGRARALEPRVPRLTLDVVRGSPAETTIEKDGLSIGRVSLGIPLPTEPGPHQIVVRAPGHTPRTYTVDLREGEQRALGLEPGAERPEAAPPPKKTARVPPSPAPERSPAPPFAYAALGAGATAAVVTGVAAVLWIVAQSTVDSECPTAHQCSDAGIRAAGSASAFRTTTLVAGSLGVAGLGTGALFLNLRPETKSPQAAGGRRDIPGMSIALSGRF